MTAFSFVFLLIIIGLYASTFKLAALLYRRVRLRWRDAVILSLMLMVVFGLGVLFNRLSGDVIPDLIGLAATVVIQVGVCAWYLASRAHRPDGQPLGSNGAAAVGLIGYAFLVPLGFLWAEMVSVMRH
ncbi:hypothetical protein GJ697_05150 [Pseudoduganella sp. FT25W]|uniref:Uncharacterized protein n=1 Tax=Duganella alba TaxID=2666081 RepID=A0A6L5QCI7_9BURK|nr:hypothetical protein [Duganella alba]MRX07218.1 hypothetical protein [Duganella alba]MRX15087.1 hypothetical protein [Duganella alba]